MEGVFPARGGVCFVAMIPTQKSVSAAPDLLTIVALKTRVNWNTRSFECAYLLSD